LTPPWPEPIKLRKLFAALPPDKDSLFEQAQKARDFLAGVVKQETVNEEAQQKQRIDAVDRYLPMALAIGKLRTGENLRSTGEKIHWKQCPIVVSKYIDRFFSSDNWLIEILHLIWLKAVLLLNSCFVSFKMNDLDTAIHRAKEVAGIFQYLSSDQLGVMSGEAIPVEFRAGAFTSLVTLSLGQAYALIALKGEQSGLPPPALGKLSYAIHITYSGALKTITAANSGNIFHRQYIDWLQAVTRFYKGAAALILGFQEAESGDAAKATGLARLAVTELEPVPGLHSSNTRVNQPAAALLAKAKERAAAWSTENFQIACRPIPSPDAVEAFLASLCTSMPNLPQAIPYTLPDPSF
jgi:hypothetical protein